MRIVNKHKNSIIYAWSISYLAILLIPIVAFSVVYFAFNKAAVNQLEQYNNLLMDSLMSGFNNALAENTKVVSFIEDSQNVSSAMNMTQLDGGAQYYLLAQLRNEMRTYANNMGIQSRFYVYFKNIDTVVSTGEVVDSREFYDMYYGKMPFSYDEWIDKITSVNEPYCAIGEKSNRFFYRAMLPISSRYNKKAALVVEMGRNALMQQMESNDNFNFDFVVFGTKKEVMFSSDGISDKKLKKLKSVTENGMYSVDGKKYMLRIEDNSERGYIGMCMTTYSKLTGKIRTVGGICVGVIFAALLFGIYMIAKNIRKNYLPLEKIVTSAGGIFSGDSNEYDVISKAVSRMKNDNRNLENVLERQAGQLKNNYLSRLMKYKMQKIDAEFIDKYKIHFPGENFVVLLFHYEDYDEFFADEKDIGDDEKFNVIVDIMRNVMEEVAQTDGVDGRIVDIDGTTTMLISFADSLIDTAEDTALQIAHFGRDFFVNQLKVYFKTAVSDLHRGIPGISEAYHQSVNIMEYSLLLGDEPILTAQSLPKAEDDYSYNFEVEQKFMNFIKTGNAQKAEEIVDRVFGNFVWKNTPDSATVTVQIYDMVGTLLKVKQDCGCSSVEIPTKWDDMYVLRDDLKGSVRALCAFCLAGTETQIKNQVEAYVQKHYADVNLGVAQIAEGLQMHRSYLSTMFKNQSGMGVLEYIGRYRLDKAKELIARGGMTVEQIALAVGYNEARTLQRIFKKYEGITVSQYGKLHNGNK